MGRDLSLLNDQVVDFSVKEELVDMRNGSVVFILGLPRSGTTLAHQILASTGLFGYGSNLAAKFYLSPAFGALLQKTFDTEAKDLFNSDQFFLSDYGRANSFLGPSEFGYFWDRVFSGLEETHCLSESSLKKVDVKSLRKEISDMMCVHQKSVILKNNTWFNSQVNFLEEVFPNSIFVLLNREPFYVAQSILLKRFNDSEHKNWWSMKPSNYRDIQSMEDSVKQVANQVSALKKDLERSLDKIVDKSKVVEINYESLCRDPTGFIRDVTTKLKDPKELSKEIRFNKTFEVGDSVRLSEQDERNLKNYLMDYLQIEIPTEV